MRTIYVDKDIPRALVVKALRPVWRNVAFSAISPSKFAEIPEPALPGSRWVRVRNRLCGICASDVSLLFVEADPDVSPVALPGYQRIYLGHETVGEVVEIGSAVTRVKLGDRVVMDTRFQGATCLSQEITPICDHCAAQNFTRCENASAGIGPRGVGGGFSDSYTAHETEIYAVPESLSADQAMMVEPLSTGMHAALKRTPKKGQRALVVGSGIVGLSVLQCVRAVAPECHLSAVARHPHQAEAAKRLGADEVIRGEDVYLATERITGAKLYTGLFGNRTLLGGFDVVYDSIGSARTLQDSLRWTRAGGSVVMVGFELERQKLDLNPIWHQEIDLTGIYAHGGEDWHGGRTRTYDVVIEQLGRNALTVEGLVTHRFPLARWREAIETTLDKRTGAIKVAFDHGAG
ncbi:MAG: zinc-binding dehydrogenase [bacterium]